MVSLLPQPARAERRAKEGELHHRDSCDSLRWLLFPARRDFTTEWLFSRGFERMRHSREQRVFSNQRKVTLLLQFSRLRPHTLAHDDRQSPPKQKKVSHRARPSSHPDLRYHRRSAAARATTARNRTWALQRQVAEARQHVYSGSDPFSARVFRLVQCRNRF